MFVYLFFIFSYICLPRSCLSADQYSSQPFAIQNYSLLIVPCGARVAVVGRIRIQCLIGSIFACGHILTSCHHWISALSNSNDSDGVGVYSLRCEKCEVSLVCPAPVSFCTLTLEVRSPESIERIISDVRAAAASPQLDVSSVGAVTHNTAAPDAIFRLRSLLPASLADSFDSALQQTGADAAVLLLSRLDSPALDWPDSYNPFRGLWRIAPSITTDRLPLPLRSPSPSEPSAAASSDADPRHGSRGLCDVPVLVSSNDLFDERLGARFVLLAPSEAGARVLDTGQSSVFHLPSGPTPPSSRGPTAGLAPAQRFPSSRWGPPPPVPAASWRQPVGQTPAARVQPATSPQAQQSSNSSSNNSASLELNVWTESEQLRDAVKEFARDVLTWLAMPAGENENQVATGRQPVLVFAGGKGVGKSTACRYALNTLLNWCVHFSCIQFSNGAVRTVVRK